jgi:cytokinesis protein
MENRTASEEKLAVEKRKQAAEDLKANRQKAIESAAAHDVEDTAVLDKLLDKLRNGDSVGRRPRRVRRPSMNIRSPAPLTLSTETIMGNHNAADMARDMLAQLKSDGFEAFTPVFATAAPRRRRLRTGSMTAGLAAELVVGNGESLQDALLPAGWTQSTEESTIVVPDTQ